jgi:hypothetical protein
MPAEGKTFDCKFTASPGWRWRIFCSPKAMRFSIGSLVLFALASFGVAGNLQPLSVKDVSLMLRSGYSSEAVEREVAVRHFMGTLDASTEKNLVQAGASPALISRLKSGAFAVSASEVAAVKAESAAKEQRRPRHWKNPAGSTPSTRRGSPRRETGRQQTPARRRTASRLW